MRVLLALLLTLCGSLCVYASASRVCVPVCVSLLKGLCMALLVLSALSSVCHWTHK